MRFKIQQFFYFMIKEISIERFLLKIIVAFQFHVFDRIYTLVI